MKVRIAVLSTAAILLAACATTSEQAYAPKSQGAYPQTRIATDDAYMAKVEYLARRRGIHLTWVNPPTKIEPKK